MAEYKPRPIFDRSKRNQPPRCALCGSKMVETFKSIAICSGTGRDGANKILLCIGCGDFFYWNYLMKDEKIKNEMS